MDKTLSAQMQSQRRTEGIGGATLGAIAPNQTSGNEVYDVLSALADRAHNLAERTESELQSVSRQAEPANATGEKVSRWHPPLFDSYLGRANSINAALMRIESALDRLEI